MVEKFGVSTSFPTTKRKPHFIAMVKILQLADRSFRTKTELTAFIRQMLKDCPEGVVPEDQAAYLFDLFTRHPLYERKVGSGVLRFEVRGSFAYKGFWFIRTDGSAEDFSFHKCINANPVSVHRSDVLKAMRNLIRYQIVNYRNSLEPTVVCELSNVVLNPRSEGHVDHIHPFIELATEFLKSCGIHEFSNVALTYGHTAQDQVTLTDLSLSARWKEFHQQRAELRLVSASANVSRSRGIKTCA